MKIKKEDGKKSENFEISRNKIKLYALENALAHKGKAVSGPVLNALFAEGLKKENISRITPLIKKAVDEINSLSIEEQQNEFDSIQKAGEKISKREVRESLPPLPNVNGKVVMRLAPFPSGPLHIGNARPYILNDEYVKNYKGKLILVIDDTISSEEKPIEPESYDLIKEGFDWLKINYDKKIIYKSDRLKIYYAYAGELIKKGYMYVCSCSKEEFQELRKQGKECPCRHLPREEQEKRWKKMFLSETKQGELVVRLKTSMQHENPAFRDRVMFRISDRMHPKIGKKYKVWPLLEFSWAIDDHLLGITHILRGIDLMMETEVEKFIWNIFHWSHPEVIHIGFFKIEGVKISKSKGAKEVHSGDYIGWNDPRLWSLQSLRDRGIKPEAIREFILNMGITKTNSTVAVDVLYAINKKYLEKSPRYFFVSEPVKIHISGAPELEANIPLHPDEFLEMGFRKYKTGQDFFISKKDCDFLDYGDYRLMHLLNFRCEKISMMKPRYFHFLSEEPQPELKVRFLHWLPADKLNEFKNVKVFVRMPDNSVISGLGEKYLIDMKKGGTAQFERFGFVSLYKKTKNHLEFWFAHS